MQPGTRTAILVAGVTFCGLFAAMTIGVAINSGFSFLTVISLGVIGMIGAGLIGAIRNPPPDDR